MAVLDVLIPTYRRPHALAVTLASLCAQQMRDFRVVISDQSDHIDCRAHREVEAVLRVLELRGGVEVYRHLPRRGMAEQRQFLFDQARAPYVLFLDDDLILEPWVIRVLLDAMQEDRCGFVGQAVIGLSYLADERPHEQPIEFWDGAVVPEEIWPNSPAWARHRLHNAANLYHVQTRLGVSPERPCKYRVAWIGGCVLYDAAKLREVGAFGFWRRLPPRHAGEDVLAQLRVMARFGGCGLLPSGVYHQELPTTVVDRRIDAPLVLGVEAEVCHGRG